MRIMRTVVIPFVLFAACFGVVIGLQHRMIERWRATPHRFRDTLYLPSSEYVRVLSLGYNHFTADFLWIRMIQVFAAAWSAAENPTQIKNYCDVVTDLDPRFTDPYKFAIMGIGEEARTHAKNAVVNREPNDPFGDPYLKPEVLDKFINDIVHKSLVRNPGNWVVPYSGAFHAWYTLDDPALAKYYIRMAKQDPEYPPYINSWEGYFDMKQGRYMAAFEKFMGDYLEAVRNNNKDYFSITENHLKRSLNSWMIDEIKARALDYEKKNGRLPTVDELNRAGAFKGFDYPIVPAVLGYLVECHNRPEMVNLSEADVNTLTRQLIRKWDVLPPGPYDMPDNPFKGYLIWTAMREDQDRFVLPTAEALAWVKRFVKVVPLDAAAQKKEGGKMPDFSYFKDNIGLTDPFGDPWIYDANTGKLTCKQYPNAGELKLPGGFEKD